MVPVSDQSDEDLLRSYAAGDPRAANALTARLLPMVYHYARRLLGDALEAEDVTQDAMLRLWRIAPNWRYGEAKVSTWLYQVTANRCIDHLRKRRSLALDEIDDPKDDRPSADAVLQDKTREAALQEALAVLPLRQRQAVVLRHIEGLGNTEIAKIMEITPRAVESLTARGKRALAEFLNTRRAELGYENEST